MAVVWDLETGPRIDIPHPTPPKFDALEQWESVCGKVKKMETRQAHMQEACKQHDDNLAGWSESIVSDWPLRPAYGRIVGGSFLDSTDSKVQLMIAGKTCTEYSVIHKCFKVFENCSKRGAKMVGFNSESFDLPFLVMRAMSLGIQIPDGFVSFDGKWFKWSVIHFDLAKIALMGRHPAMCKWSFSEMAQLFGTSGKPDGVEGKEIWKLIQDNELDKVQEYMKQDVLQPLQWLRKIVKTTGSQLFYDVDVNDNRLDDRPF